MHLALGEAGGARPGANGIGRLSREQRLIAGDEVRRQEVLLEMAGQGVRGELQRSLPQMR